MVIAMRAVFVTFLVRAHVLPKRTFAFLAKKGHFKRLRQLVIGLFFGVTFGTVEPLAATWCADCDLSVEDVLAAVFEVPIRTYTQDIIACCTNHIDVASEGRSLQRAG